MQGFGRTSSIVLFLLYLLTGWGSVAQAQQPPALAEKRFKILSIVVTGNKKTKAHVILREMLTKVGDRVTVEQLEMDRRRIESLGLFARVQMQAQPQADDGIILYIEVTEQWYIFPVPIFFFNDREFKLKKLTYGAQVAHVNFRGRAEFLQLAGVLGYNPGLSILYTKPWIFGRARYFISLRFFVSRMRNKSSEIRDEKLDENQLGGGLTFGKRLTLRSSISLGLAYKRLRSSPADAATTLNPSGHDRLPQASLTFTRDYRDLVFYPTRGSFASITFKKIGFPGDAFVDYSRINLDLRKYFPLGKKTSFGLRYLGNFSNGTIPSYDRLFFGFFTRLRGYFSERLEGEQRMLASAEFRFPITRVFYYTLENSALGAYGRDLKFGISGSLFFEAGTLWLQKNSPALGSPVPLSTGPYGLQTRPRKWLYSYGVGLNFHLPYVNIARVELAFNDQKDIEIIFDSGITF